MFDSDDFRFAVNAVRRAARLVGRVQQEMVDPALTKHDRSPVTVGDFAAQAVVARLLLGTFPDDPLVGEESAAALRADDGRAMLNAVTAFVRHQAPQATPDEVLEWIDRGGGEPHGRFWTLDPIDGTKGFLRGEQFAVCLALVEDGVVQLGVLGCPNLNPHGKADIGGRGALVVAGRGHGAWAVPLDGDAEFVQLHVSAIEQSSQARLLRSVESGHTDTSKIDELTAALSITADPVPMDSQAKYAVLAAGGGDVITRLLSPSRPDYREMIWDQAAGSLVVEEAGGRVTDLDGQPLDFRQGRTLARNRGVLASNGRLHEALLAGLRKIGA